MSTVERSYFRLKGKLKKMAEAWDVEVSKSLDEKCSFVRRSTKTRSKNPKWRELAGTLVALKGDHTKFKGWKAPPKWLQDKGVGAEVWMVPDKRTKAGREFQKEMESLSRPKPTALFEVLKVGDGSVFLVGNDGNFYLCHHVIMNLSGNWYLSSPVDAKKAKAPNNIDATPIKEWQFLKSLEEENEGRKTKRRKKTA